MNRKELVEKINSLDALTTEEKSALIDLLKQKKYGLVWENKPENVEERLRAELPVLKEVKEKALLDGGEDAPNHILIEGDNLEVLTALAYTHENKIDVIYIDPPYNTGNRDFVYNDSFVDSEDGYRHSKWLSFMDKRLRIAKRLLSDRGVIFISIDDNEQANLKLLCDEVFEERNQIATLPTIMNLKGNQDEFGFAGTHEYTIVYAKSKMNSVLNEYNVDESELESWEEDAIGYYKKGATLKRTGEDAPRDKRPYGYYPILVRKEDNEVCSIQEDEYIRIYNKETKEFNDDFVSQLLIEYQKKGFYTLLPIIGDIKGSWRWGYKTLKNDSDEVIVTKGRDGLSLYKKQRPELGSLPTKKPKTIFYKAQYSSGNGTQQLFDVLKNKLFSNPKPIDLIKDFIIIGSSKSSLILDFFAGSGTTLHATMQLNAEDGGHRKCILVTNNENNICEEVTYERNKRVINGYITPKGEEVEGLKANNLRYYQIDHVERESSLTAKRKLMAASAELLCIKHDIYEESTTFGTLKLKPHIARYFTSTSSAQANDKQQMLVIYMVEAIERIVEEIETMPEDTNIMVYVFSTNNYAMDADFEDVADKVTLCALPAAIYNAYLKVLPKKGEPKQIIEEDAE